MTCLVVGGRWVRVAWRGVEGWAVSEFAGYASRLEATPQVVASAPVAEPGSQIGKRTRVESEGVGPKTTSAAASIGGQVAEPANEWRPDDALSFGPPAPMA